MYRKHRNRSKKRGATSEFAIEKGGGKKKKKNKLTSAQVRYISDSLLSRPRLLIIES